MPGGWIDRALPTETFPPGPCSTTNDDDAPIPVFALPFNTPPVPPLLPVLFPVPGRVTAPIELRLFKLLLVPPGAPPAPPPANILFGDNDNRLGVVFCTRASPAQKLESALFEPLISGFTVFDFAENSPLNATDDDEDDDDDEG